MSDTDDFTGAILFCPVCCSNVDVDEPDQSKFECASCGQEWSLELDLARIAQHSIH